MSAKNRIKKTLTWPFSACGLFSATRALAGGRAFILCYHRVVEGPLDHYQPGMVISPDTFRRHLEWLGKHFELVDLVDFAGSFLAGGAQGRPRAIITFDDGWLDNYQVAFPLLKRMGVPATIFLPTDFIGTGRSYWNARAEHAIRRIHQRRHSLIRAFPDEEMPPEAAFLMDLLVEDPPLEVMIDRIINRIKLLPPPVMERITGFLDLLGETDAELERTIMDWEEVSEMAAAGVSFGAHSVTHRLMTDISAAECYRESSESMRVMAEKMGQRPLSFAYPNGNYDENVVREVRRAGYLCAVTIEAGFANRGRDLFTLPRFCVHEGAAPTEAVLDFLLSGLQGR